MTRTLCAVTLGVTHSAACRESVPARSIVPTRHLSAGVEVVDNGAVDQAFQWTFDPSPIVSIGGGKRPGPSAFKRVTGALRLTDGQILVSDGPAGEVRLFDPGGRFVRLVGRKGSEPGEFEFPFQPARVGASWIAVMDPFARRAVLFDEKLELIASPRLGYEALGRPYVLEFVGLLSQAEGLGRQLTWLPAPFAGARWQNATPIVRARLDGTVLDTIAIGRCTDLYGAPYRVGFDSGLQGVPLAMGSQTEVAMEAGRIFVGETAEPSVGVWTTAGRAVRIIRWSCSRDRVTNDDKRQHFLFDSAQAAASSQSEARLSASYLRALREKEFAEHAPCFTALIPTEDGGLWIERFPRPWTPMRQYLVADSTGTILATASIPREYRPLQVGSNWMLGRWRGADGTDRIQLHRIVR
jgi:hypothetical protein